MYNTHIGYLPLPSVKLPLPLVLLEGFAPMILLT